MGRELGGGGSTLSGASSSTDPVRHPHSLESTKGRRPEPGPIQTGPNSSSTAKLHRGPSSPPDPTAEENYIHPNIQSTARLKKI